MTEEVKTRKRTSLELLLEANGISKYRLVQAYGVNPHSGSSNYLKKFMGRSKMSWAEFEELRTILETFKELKGKSLDLVYDKTHVKLV